MIALIDERMDEACRRALIDRGFEVVRLPACEILQAPVSAHPDMLLFVGKGMLFCHEKYYAIAKKEIDLIIEQTGLSLSLSGEAWEEKYPSDVLFNAVAMGDKLICNKRSVSKLILEAYGEENLINTKQGYTKCSTCAVGAFALITADTSIATAARGAGLDVLLLNGSHTVLDGYDTGFIGGASGDDGEHIFFSGSIESHPEYDKIKSFCTSHGREAISLSDKPLYDYGSIIFI